MFVILLPCQRFYMKLNFQQRHKIRIFDEHRDKAWPMKSSYFKEMSVKLFYSKHDC